MATIVLITLAALALTSACAMNLNRFSYFPRDGDTDRTIDDPISRYYGMGRNPPNTVLMEELDPNGDRVLVEFAYSDGKKQFPNIEERGRVAYNIIRDTLTGGESYPKEDEDFISSEKGGHASHPAAKPEIHRDTQDTREGSKNVGDVETTVEEHPYSESEPPRSDERIGDELDPIPHWSLTEFTEDSPISSKFPKYFVDILSPLSPFPEASYGTEKRDESGGDSSSESLQKKDDTPFFPSDEVRPPPRAGPNLFPQSTFEREFRIPIN